MIPVCLVGTNKPRHFLSAILVSISLAVVINCVQLANKPFPEDLFFIFSYIVSFVTPPPDEAGSVSEEQAGDERSAPVATRGSASVTPRAPV